MADRFGSTGSGRPGDPLSEIRRVAARRRAVAQRLRRFLPGLVVGSATLAGTGAVAAWVGNQPGVSNASSAVPATTPRAPTTADVIGALAGQLRTDTQQVNALQSTLATLQQQRAAATAAAASAASGSQAAPAPSLAPVATLPPLPPIPSVSITPAPAVNATTGASHAVP